MSGLYEDKGKHFRLNPMRSNSKTCPFSTKPLVFKLLLKKILNIEKEHKILCSCLVFCFPLSILNISLFSLVAHMNSEERSVVILIFVPLQVSFPPTSYRKFSLVLIFCSLKMMPRCWPSSCLMFSELSGPVIEYVTLICGRFCYYCIKYVLLFLYLSSISF